VLVAAVNVPVKVTVACWVILLYNFIVSKVSTGGAD
jgi:hypothetical protein